MSISWLMENRRVMVSEEKAVKQVYTEQCRKLHEKYIEYYDEKANDFLESAVNAEIMKDKWTGFFRNIMVVKIGCKAVEDFSDSYARKMLDEELKELNPDSYQKGCADMLKARIDYHGTKSFNRIRLKYPNWNIIVQFERLPDGKSPCYKIVVHKPS